MANYKVDPEAVAHYAQDVPEADREGLLTRLQVAIFVAAGSLVMRPRAF